MQLKTTLALAFLPAFGCRATQPETERTYLEHTIVRITELHYDPSAEQGQVEFIEVANVSPGERADVSGWQLTGAGRLAIPPGTVLAPGEAVVFVQDAAAFQQAFGSGVRPLGTLDGKLRNEGEVVRLEDAQGRVADEVIYSGAGPEEEKAAGTGLSLHRVSIAPAADRGIWRAREPSPGIFETRRGDRSRAASR